MRLSRRAFKNILWPKDGATFAMAGGAMGLFGDVTSFFSNFLSPLHVLALFGALAGVTALLCVQRVSLTEMVSAGDAEKAAHCSACSTMRFSLFAVLASLLLVFIGQGKSATEAVGEKLGLIHADVQKVQQDVSAIRQEIGGVSDNVSDIHAVIQSQKIIGNPNSPEAFFANAWAYMNMHRDPEKALASLDDMYSRFSPRKMDVADLYYNAARTSIGRETLIKKLVEQGVASQDATLVAIAARYAPDEDQSQELYRQARAMDPELPFAYWDIQRVSNARNSIDIEERKAIAEKQIVDLEKFISLISDKPIGYYFYLPQYQPDHDMMARQTLANMNTMLESLKKAIALKNASAKK